MQGTCRVGSCAVTLSCRSNRTIRNKGILKWKVVVDRALAIESTFRSAYLLLFFSQQTFVESNEEHDCCIKDIRLTPIKSAAPLKLVPKVTRKKSESDNFNIKTIRTRSNCSAVFCRV